MYCLLWKYIVIYLAHKQGVQVKLISFSINNYASFLTEQTVEFNLDDKNVDAFFGPNGSGKTNLFNALAFFKTYIRNSTSFQARNISYSPFAFSVENQNLPTKFKAEMQSESEVYLYSFSILDGTIVNEILRQRPIGKAKRYTTIFRRSSISKNRYEAYGFTPSLLSTTRDDALVLTKAWENNNKYALRVFEWIEHLQFVSGDQNINETAKRVMEDDKFKTKVLDLLRRADLYIQDISVSQVNMPDEFLKNLPFTNAIKSKIDRIGYNVMTTHMVYDAAGSVIQAKAMPVTIESKGTMRIFELAYPIIDTLEKGNILYIDEFETYLHPRECTFLVGLFESQNNKNNAQLIINTHNTQLIDQIGRNSVHLVGKNNKQETILGRIPKDIRSDDKALEKKYTKGMFGATPNIEQ